MPGKTDRKIRAKKNVLVTGCAGFIGFHTATRLLQQGYRVLGVDNLNPFYNQGLKSARLRRLQARTDFQFVQGDLADRETVASLVRGVELQSVVHLAAQAGVRYSLENPHLYIQSNIVAFVNLAEELRHQGLSHFLFASSSSVYGENRKVPFGEQDNVDHPISFYAATKKSNELIAHTYAHLYAMPMTGLRLFTVYGPWGRPDMAIFKFCKAIEEGTAIQLYNRGRMRRDFTYVDDVVESIVRLLARPFERRRSRPSGDVSPYYRIFNLGNHQPVELCYLIQVLEKKLGKKAIVELLPMQPGDVPVTYARMNALSREIGFRPKTPIEDGIGAFVNWYREYYNSGSASAASGGG